MINLEFGTADDTLGYCEEKLQAPLHVSAAAHAAHLLPNLKPGHGILDLGCVPWAISNGLTEATSPGEIHGICVEKLQFDLAEFLAARWTRQYSPPRWRRDRPYA
ncbi:MAG: hypothetical protein OXG64_08055 [Chloroflexi bacterium]|nr:hypothetical protein [Chloroflexota bacterium]